MAIINRLFKIILLFGVLLGVVTLSTFIIALFMKFHYVTIVISIIAVLYFIVPDDLLKDIFPW